MKTALINRLIKIGGFFILTLVSAVSLGLFVWEIRNWHIVPSYGLNNALTPESQAQIIKAIISSFFAISVLSVSLYLIARVAGRLGNDSARFLLTRLLRFISFLFVIPFVVNEQVWWHATSLMALITLLSVVYIYRTAKGSGICSAPFLKKEIVINNVTSYIILTLLILGYACYFSYYTILNHYHLQTHALDLGLLQNACVNTLHGNFMSVSYAPYFNACLFFDHYDFIFLIYLPFFYLFSRTETLLIIQSLSIAMAALPLFLLCKKVLKSNFASLIIAAAFLLHPANHGANFYDVHQLSFLPLCAFLLFYFLETKNTFGFITSIVLFLSVKEDMYILLFFLALFIYLNDRKNLRFAGYCFGACVIYGVIYNFVDKIWGINQQFFYYESLMLNRAGGAGEILKTIITNPVYVLHKVFIKEKILYFCQLFGPVLFIPLLRKRNYLLFIFGLAVTLLGTHMPLYQIAFQYVWYIVPFLFLCLLYVLRDIQTNDASLFVPLRTLRGRIQLLLIAVFLASLAFSWKYGAVLNRRHFVGGFNTISFKFTAEDKKRLQDLNDIISMIPVTASIGASEMLCPQLPNNRKISAFLHLYNKPDYLLLKDPNFEKPNCLEYLKNKCGYKVILRKGGFQLLKKPE
ncbi:MAG: DUF2079 domain-containing protein [Candidatus Omnitrophica bacterium]|nr:DUF2079 domain-containing protein [Candidatus Omnitrophota bacterium]